MNRLLSSIVISSAIVLVVIFALSIDEPEIETQIEHNSTKTISIGTIHRDPAKMTDRYQPLATYVATKLSDEDNTYRGRIVIPSNQEQMILSIQAGDVDIYLDSPLIGQKISDATNMNPELLVWKEGVSSYHSVFITSADSEIHSLDNLHGKTIVFEDNESTSGYILPKNHLESLGYTLGDDSDLDFVFSLDDENTPIWVIEGRGDIGVISNIDYDDLSDNLKNQLKIIGITMDVPRQILYFRDGLETKNEIKEILLEMNLSDHYDIFDSAKMTKFSVLEPLN